MRRMHVVVLSLLVACGGGTGGAGGDGGPGPDPVDADFSDGAVEPDAMPPGCEILVCETGQRCEIGASGPECVNQTCGDLNCSATELCEPTPNGGAVCVDNSCSADLECEPSQFCNGTICVDDVCTESAARCDGQDLYVCAANGGQETLEFTCGGAAYFNSVCEDDGSGGAACSCEDDWDCPANTRCEGRQCQGTGDAPSCLLEPQAFTNALPVNEITWGGLPTNLNATGSPFESSSQVVQTVLVANLDDDNSDGIIDDRDTPEIIFTTFCGTFASDDGDFRSNGVLRAIHGGGPNKGQDFFANCGGTLWNEGDALPISCTCSSGDLDSTSSLAVADINYDGVPEIVAITEGNGSNDGSARIYSNTGVIISTSSEVNLGGDNPAVGIHNLDGVGPAEIVIGRDVFGVDSDLNFINYWEGDGFAGRNGQGPSSCVANFDPATTSLEILGGTTMYGFPSAPNGITAQSDCTGSETGDEERWCDGDLITLWDAQTVNASAIDDGFCSAADVWGATAARPGPANPLDGVPEVVIVSDDPGTMSGNDDNVGTIQVFNGVNGALLFQEALNAGRRGGPPNIDDFDGDGFPEVGTAGATNYVVVDFQAPTAACTAWNTAPATDALSVESANTARTPPAGTCTADVDCGDTSQFACNQQTMQCICLHNSWRRGTEDDSSRVTGSSVFDFNGDGAAEVVYNDECRFRIYDGLDGTVYMREPSESRTRIEYPVIADVDNDGNAEIVFSTSNESGFCSEEGTDPMVSSYNNGIEVWGDQNDFWVSARRIWNQHSYAVTNITEDGMPPTRPPESWGVYNGRTYNIYRSNPRNVGVAPDLVVRAVQFTSPGAACGALSTTIEISVQIDNIGDVRGGQGSVVSFTGEWSSQLLTEVLYADGAMTPLTFTIPESIDPGGQLFFTLSYDAMNNTPNALPDEITVVADDPLFNPPNGFERECDEDNAFVAAVTGGEAAPDLRVELGTPLTAPTCPTLPTTIFNDGAVAVSGVLVRYYAGDPFQGGTAIHDEVFAQSIPAGGSVSADVEITNGVGNQVTVFAIVDPLNAIAECNDGNNSDAADAPVSCNIIN